MSTEQMLSNQELRDLSRPNGAHTALALGFDWGLIIAALTLVCAAPHPITYLVTFLVIGRQQLALALMMHDGSHGRFTSSRKLNDYLCQFLCAAPLFFSMYSYRTLHLKHHQEPLAPDDPDMSLIGNYPISKQSFARKLLRDLFGVSYFKFIRYFIYMARKPQSPSRRAENSPKKALPTGQLSLAVVVFSMLLINGVLLGALAASGHAWYYLFFWFLPTITILQVLLRIRGVAEHAGFKPNPDQRLNARTVINPIQTFIFAPHNAGFHIEHHLYPSIPCSNLPEVHRLLMQRGALPKANIFYSYLPILKDIIK